MVDCALTASSPIALLKETCRCGKTNLEIAVSGMARLVRHDVIAGALHRYGTSSRHSKHAVRVVEVFEEMGSSIGGSQGFLPSTQ